MENKFDSRLIVLALLFLLAITVYLLRMRAEVVELVETNRDTEFVKIHIQIPRFRNTNNLDFENSLNSKIQEKVRSIVEEVKVAAHQAAEDGTLRTKYEVYISTEMKFKSKDFVSLVIYYYTFTGGAHGITTFDTYNIDLKNSQLLTLKDIFSETCNYEKMIKDFITKQIISRKEEFFPEAVEYINNDDITKRVFTITKESLQIYYEDYEIAPHSTGLPVFEIPLSLLKPCLRVRID
jgi:ribosomal protein L31E